jgi:hypothetical protein
MIRGSAAHSAKQNFYKFNLHRCANVHFDDLRRTAIELMEDEFNDRVDKIGGAQAFGITDDEMQFLVHESRDMMINFLDDFISSHGFERDAPLIEKAIYSKELPLMARLDSLDLHTDPPVVRDLKTSQSKEITPDIERQMGLCALLVHEKYGTWPDLEVHFLRFKDGVVKLNVPQSERDSIAALVESVYKKTESRSIRDYPCTCGCCAKNQNYALVL